MSDNRKATVTPIRDGVVAPGEVDPEIIRILNEALERAQEGSFVGIGVVMLARDSSAVFFSHWQDRCGNAMIGLFSRIQNDAIEAIDDDK